MTFSTAMLPTVLRKKSASTLFAAIEFSPGRRSSRRPKRTLEAAATAEDEEPACRPEEEVAFD